LAYYASRFNSVEINATFYRLPSVNAVKGWRERSPTDFIFAVKGSRFITHIKRLKANRVSLRKYFNRIKWLKGKCGPVLWQLGPYFKFDDKRLDMFLGKLPTDYRHAVEFRHLSWYEHEATFEVLRRHRAAHVSLSSQQMPTNLSVTADFIYIRFHGLQQGRAHDYTRDELRPWAEHCRRYLNTGRDVYAYFNNDANTRAPFNAVSLRELISKPLAQRAA
jgi:uncharacterized protein YecE (DUF72 family)